MRLILFLLILGFGLPLLAGAQIVIDNPLRYASIQELIDAVIKFIFLIALVVSPLMIVIGAFYLMTAAGDPGRVKTAKTIFLYTAVGLFVIFLARGLVALIRSAMGVTP
jgi:magnesium-transporting ATPase (P-type)